jgi:hypothetical protein
MNNLVPNLQNTGNFNITSLEHILFGNINGSGRATGYHHKTSSPIGEIEDIIRGPNGYGFYEAKVKVNGIAKNQPSTMFPDNWSPQKIVDEVNSAFTNKKFISGSTNTFEGIASNGMKIQMFIDSNGKIISAFPVY